MRANCFWREMRGLGEWLAKKRERKFDLGYSKRGFLQLIKAKVRHGWPHMSWLNFIKTFVYELWTKTTAFASPKKPPFLIFLEGFTLWWFEKHLLRKISYKETFLYWLKRRLWNFFRDTYFWLETSYLIEF